jgi:hypothetical protein
MNLGLISLLSLCLARSHGPPPPPPLSLRWATVVDPAQARASLLLPSLYLGWPTTVLHRRVGSACQLRLLLGDNDANIVSSTFVASSSLPPPCLAERIRIEDAADPTKPHRPYLLRHAAAPKRLTVASAMVVLRSSPPLARQRIRAQCAPLP